MIYKEDIQKAQDSWGKAIVKIGEFKTHSKECEEFTLNQLKELYEFDTDILFKPTKAAVSPFRPDITAALSYFIGGNNEFSEDGGFALNPWTKVRFKNHQIKILNDSALAMGHYYFTDLENKETMVEYTFGYVKSDNKLKIILHHSSLPYNS